MDTDTYERVFRPRAIERDVAEARPHVPFEQGDEGIAAVLAADPGWKGKRILRTVVGQSSGVAMRRHPALDLVDFTPTAHPVWVTDKDVAYENGTAPILAELRPDRPVLVRERAPHHHERMSEAARVDHLTSWTAARGDSEAVKARKAKKRTQKPREFEHFQTTHHERGLVWHVHAHEAKYVFPSGPSNAKRLDVHPGARGLVEKVCADGGVLFYALEGCLKADALLSAGHAVVSVPSVSLWHPAELSFFAESMVGPETRVVVLTDSDARRNEDVMFYGVAAVDEFRRLGISAVLGAPADLDGDPKTGIDDWLAKGRDALAVPILEHSVEPLDVLEDVVREVVGQVREAAPRKDWTPTVARVFRWHLLRATSDGLIRGSVKSCVRTLWPEVGTRGKPFQAKVRQVKRARAEMRDSGLLRQVEPIRRSKKWGSNEWVVLPPVDLVAPEHFTLRVTEDAEVADLLSEGVGV